MNKNKDIAFTRILEVGNYGSVLYNKGLITGDVVFIRDALEDGDIPRGIYVVTLTKDYCGCGQDDPTFKDMCLRKRKYKLDKGLQYFFLQEVIIDTTLTRILNVAYHCYVGNNGFEHLRLFLNTNIKVMNEFPSKFTGIEEHDIVVVKRCWLTDIYIAVDIFADLDYKLFDIFMDPREPYFKYHRIDLGGFDHSTGLKLWHVKVNSELFKHLEQRHKATLPWWKSKLTLWFHNTTEY